MARALHPPLPPMEAVSVDDRLRLLVTLLKREAAMVTGLSMRPAVELPQMPYASN